MQHIIIKPEIVGDIHYVKASTESIYGKITVNWKLNGNTFILDVNIPLNTTADVYLPDGTTSKTVNAGKYSFSTVVNAF